MMTPLQAEWGLCLYSVLLNGWFLFRRTLPAAVVMPLWAASWVGIGVCIGWTWP